MPATILTPRWRVLIAAYAFVGAAIALGSIFVGPTVAPCLGITPATMAACVAVWQAHRSWLDLLVEAWGPVPIGFVVFLGLCGITAVVQPSRANSSNRRR
jgi:hypothetical protein